METITGEIQNIKKNGLGLQINGIWYSSFKVIPSNFKKGDNIKLGFLENKGFKNIKLLDPIKEPKEVTANGYEFNKQGNLSKSDESLLKPILSATDKNCILMTAKDIYTSPKNDVKFEQILEEVKRLRLNL